MQPSTLPTKQHWALAFTQVTELESSSRSLLGKGVYTAFTQHLHRFYLISKHIPCHPKTEMLSSEQDQDEQSLLKHKLEKQIVLNDPNQRGFHAKDEVLETHTHHQ